MKTKPFKHNFNTNNAITMKAMIIAMKEKLHEARDTRKAIMAPRHVASDSTLPNAAVNNSIE